MRGVMLSIYGKGGVLFPTKTKIEGKSHVCDLQNGFLFSSSVGDDDKVLFQGIGMMKHKCDT